MRQWISRKVKLTVSTDGHRMNNLSSMPYRLERSLRQVELVSCRLTGNSMANIVCRLRKSTKKRKRTCLLNEQRTMINGNMDG
mmetsp:Transcript_9670/g.23811  ORF Transcript_9670/g.23811 Transcript_9670/m.23811 type:complete len:83 (-) Transcript_9670:163-411(-)